MFYWWGVIASFCGCGTLWFSFYKFGGCTVEQGCSRTSLVHHIIAMVLGMMTHYQYAEAIAEDASFAPNDQFPLAVALQHFNLGYFLYDTCHVIIWDRKWLLHHTVAIAGYSTSEISNVFGLANSVNTWITELGSLMYSAYLVLRTEQSYIGFVSLYSLTRLYLLYWCYEVLSQVWNAFQGKSKHTFPDWAPYCAATLQLLLVIVNITFLMTHYRKLWKRYVKGEMPKKGE
mmetsp:Transcript_78611/g.163387  ORF Transcript_78611/g.163387 Transcript_78611/m.163387 type:complete len:231 (+) Transcript_78611:122-814(+)